MFDALKLYADEIAGVAEPGEHPLGTLTITYVAGEEAVGPQMTYIQADPLHGFEVAAWDTGVERMISGRTLEGNPASLAVSLARAVDSKTLDLVITNQRLWLLEGLASSDPLRIIWCCPHSALRRVERDPFWNQRGRLAVTFCDGSSVRLMGGYLFSGKTRRFAEICSQTLLR